MRAFLLAFAAVLLSGCAILAGADSDWLKKYEPPGNSVVKIHPFGMPVYNNSGKEMSETEWRNVFTQVNEAYDNLRKCLDFDNAFEQTLKHRIKKLVILPPEIIIIPKITDNAVAVIRPEFYPNASGPVLFEAFFKIFVRNDYAAEATIRHELAHAYIFLKNYEEGKELNHPHKNPIFCSCVDRAYCDPP